MIDVNTDFPTTEDFLEGIQRCASQLQEATVDMQYLAKKFADGNYYMTASQLAKMLQCEVDNLPNIRRVRSYCGREYLYKKSDVDSWLESHTIGGKK